MLGQMAKKALEKPYITRLFEGAASFKLNRCKCILWLSIFLTTLYGVVFHLFHAFQNVFEKNATRLRLFTLPGLDFADQ